MTVREALWVVVYVLALIFVCDIVRAEGIHSATVSFTDSRHLRQAVEGFIAVDRDTTIVKIRWEYGYWVDSATWIPNDTCSQYREWTYSDYYRICRELIGVTVMPDDIAHRDSTVIDSASMVFRKFDPSKHEAVIFYREIKR